MKLQSRVFVAVSCLALLASCAAVLGLPDPTLDDTIPVGGGSSSGTASSSGSSGGGDGSTTEDGGGNDGSTVVDGGDGGALTCLKRTPWGNVTKLSVSNNLYEFSPTLTEDELTIAWLTVTDPANPQGQRVPYYALRADAAAPFGVAIPALGPNPPPYITSVCLGPRGDELFIGGDGLALQMQRFKRLDAGGYGDGVNQNGLDVPYQLEACRSLIADAGVMYFHGENPGTNPGAMMFRAVRNGSDAWGSLSAVAGIGDAGTDRSPVVRADELEIFFARRAGFDDEIYTATRAKTSDPWGAPTKVTELSMAGTDAPGWLSRDGCRLYFTSARGDGGAIADLYVATRSP